MRAGELRHYITIQQKTLVADGLGGFTETWTTFKQVYAAIYPVRANELFELKQVQLNTTHRVRIRYMDKVTADMRILFKDRYLYITAIVNPDERNVYLEMLCNEVV
jgi:SPP1 family predicted phage head-tail adaptor